MFQFLYKFCVLHFFFVSLYFFPQFPLHLRLLSWRSPSHPRRRRFPPRRRPSPPRYRPCPSLRWSPCHRRHPRRSWKRWCRTNIPRGSVPKQQGQNKQKRAFAECSTIPAGTAPSTRRRARSQPEPQFHPFSSWSRARSAPRSMLPGDLAPPHPPRRRARSAAPLLPAF